jgi:hypothetical protein
MSFKPGNLVQWNVTPTPPKRGLPQWWGYFTTDTIATVQAADYFNLNYGLVIGRNTTWYVGDQIYCVCADGVTELQITAVTPNVTTTAGNANIPAGSITHAMLGANIVDLNNLAAGITPSSIVQFSGQYTTVGGAAAEAIVVAGALATDLAFVQLVNHGPNTVSVAFAVMTANTLTVTYSANPGAGTIVNWQVLRVPT